MTDTSHPVTRRTVGEHPRHKRRVIVSIGPGDTLSFRLERSQQAPFHLPIDKLYDQAEIKHAAVINDFNPAPRKGRRAIV